MKLRIHTRTFEMDDNLEAYASLYKAFLEAGVAAVADFEKIYYNCETFDKAWSKFQTAAVGVAQLQCEFACNFLFNAGILTVDVDEFINKYYYKYMDIDPHIEPITAKLSQISDYAFKLEQIRDIKNSNRSHWVGGGFGLQGAIAGAVAASVFNTAGSMLNGIGNVLRESSDSDKISKLKQEILYDHQTLKAMCDAMLVCSLGAFRGLIDEMVFYKLLDPINLRTREAVALNRNVQKYVTEKDKRLDMFLDCICMDPFNDELYVPLFNEFPDTKGLDAFADNFGILALRKYLHQSKINLRLSLIENKFGNSIKDQCARIVEYASLEQDEGMNLDERIWDIAKKLVKENGKSSRQLEVVLTKFDEYCPGDKPPKAQLVINDIKFHWLSLCGKEDKEYILKMPDYDLDTIIKKVNALVIYSNKYSKNADDRIIDLLRKALTFCKKEKDFVNLQDKIKKLSGQKVPTSAVMEACNYKFKMYEQERKIEWHLLHLFTPDLLDIVTLAREGSAVHQLWLIRSICPDVLLMNSEAEDGYKQSRLPEFLPTHLSSLISFLFDSPEKYPFDLFMRMRANLVFEPQEEYCEVLESFENCDLCPAGMYEYGKYACLAGITSGMSSIERAAMLGYYPAIAYILKMNLKDEKILKHQHPVFYEVLGAGETEYKKLYDFKYHKEEDFLKLICFVSSMRNLAYGYFSAEINGNQSLSDYIESIWNICYKSKLEANIYRIGFHKAERENTHILEAVKFLEVKMNNEVPIFSFILDWRAQDKHSKYIDQEVFLVTTRGVYWNQKENLYNAKYTNVDFSGCADFPRYYSVDDTKLWWQVFSLTYYAMLPYQHNLSRIVLEKLAFCGNPFAICKLLNCSDISEERREVWESVRARWEQKGKYFAVCPCCSNSVTADDFFCPECGSKIIERRDYNDM